jgi:hypothetical protein
MSQAPRGGCRRRFGPGFVGVCVSRKSRQSPSAQFASPDWVKFQQRYQVRNRILRKALPSLELSPLRVASRAWVQIIPAPCYTPAKWRRKSRPRRPCNSYVRIWVLATLLTFCLFNATIMRLRETHPMVRSRQLFFCHLLGGLANALRSSRDENFFTAPGFPASLRHYV